MKNNELDSIRFYKGKKHLEVSMNVDIQMMRIQLQSLKRGSFELILTKKKQKLTMHKKKNREEILLNFLKKRFHNQSLPTHMKSVEKRGPSLLRRKNFSPDEMKKTRETFFQIFQNNRKLIKQRDDERTCFLSLKPKLVHQMQEIKSHLIDRQKKKRLLALQWIRIIAMVSMMRRADRGFYQTKCRFEISQQNLKNFVVLLKNQSRIASKLQQDQQELN